MSKYVFKYLFIGDKGCGTSTLLTHFCQESHFESQKVLKHTIGLDYFYKRFKIPGHEIDLNCQIWDLTGLSNHKTLQSEYYSKPTTVFFVYDITNKETFRNLHDHIKFFKNNVKSSDYLMVILGMKSDQKKKREVFKHSVLLLANSEDAYFFESSNFEYKSIDFIMKSISLEVYNKISSNKKRRKSMGVLDLQSHPVNKNCCHIL